MEIQSRISGVTYDDPVSGRPRQEIIRQLVKPGMRLEPIYEPDNPYGDNAVGLWIGDGENRHHLGYIPKEIAFECAEIMRAGARLDVHVIGVTGTGKYKRGVSILIRDRLDDAKVYAVTKRHRKRGCWWYIVRIGGILLLLLLLVICVESVFGAGMPLHLV